jgi:SAM-dependent methyltransferase
MTMLTQSSANPLSPRSTTALDAKSFKLPDAAIEEVLRRYTRRTFDTTTPEWQEERARSISKRRLGLRRWLSRLLLSGSNARDQVDVRSGYEAHWEQKDALERYVVGQDERVLTVAWRDRGMQVAAQVLRHVHLLYLMRAIEAVRAQNVLEVGFGNGNMVLTLAPLFPEVSFSGVELTQSGLAIAQALQEQPVLPAPFAERAPAPLRDLTAHRRVDLKVGDARALPFPDQSFDLVYTRLALEQMEEIRHEALREVTRVARRAVVLIECWRDFNRNGPGRDYVRRQGYFSGKAADLDKLGFRVALATDDLPQKIQFSSGPVVALRK